MNQGGKYYGRRRAEEKKTSHDKVYTDLVPIMEDVFIRYRDEVREHMYPGPEHTVYMSDEDVVQFAKDMKWESKLAELDNKNSKKISDYSSGQTIDIPGIAVDDGAPRSFLDPRVGKLVLAAGRDHCIVEMTHELKAWSDTSQPGKSSPISPL